MERGARSTAVDEVSPSPRASGGRGPGGGVQRRSPMPARVLIQSRINGEEVDFLCEPRQSLLEVLRETLGLTGTKEGCNNGNCGACNVMLDGRIVNSCC